MSLTIVNIIATNVFLGLNFIQADLIDNDSLNVKPVVFIALSGILLSTFLIKRKEFKQIFLTQPNNNLEDDLEPKNLPGTAVLEKSQKNISLIERIIKLTPNIIYIYDLEKKCNIYSNSSIAEKLGYSDSEIESMNKQLFSKLLHPKDAKAIAEHQQECLKLSPGEYLTIEYRMQDQQGDWHWLASKDTVFEQDDLGRPTQILGIAQDITEIKQHQSAATTVNLELVEKVAALETWRDKHLKLAAMNEF
ncbi:MAG: hypothetical protein RLZZ74_2507, partial [Cyanobacteriota bacterium]